MLLPTLDRKPISPIRLLLPVLAVAAVVASLYFVPSLYYVLKYPQDRAVGACANKAQLVERLGQPDEALPLDEGRAAWVYNSYTWDHRQVCHILYLDANGNITRRLKWLGHMKGTDLIIERQ
jgi:hypothetical protein